MPAAERGERFSYHWCRWGWGTHCLLLHDLPGLCTYGQDLGRRGTTSSGRYSGEGALEVLTYAKSMGPGGMHLRVLRDLDMSIATLYHPWKVVEIGRVAQWLENGKCSTCLQERQEASRELQAGQLHFGPWKNHEPSLLGSHLRTCESVVVDLE